MGDCVASIASFNDFASKDTSRLLSEIGKAMARTSPWINILKGGTVENNFSDVIRSVIQESAMPAASLVRPAFTADINTCSLIPNADQVGTTEYTFQLETLRGRGPRVCVKQARMALENSYIMAFDSMKKAITEIINADIKAQLYARSGLKMVVNASINVGFSSMISGDQNQVNASFANIAGSGGLPNGQLSFTLLHRLMRYMREALSVEHYKGAGTEGSFVFIGSDEIIERFRAELQIREDLRSAVTGKYKIGEESILGYQFQGPYRGISFSTDQTPLRFNTSVGGQPSLIEPFVAVATTRGVGRRINPPWLSANYEVGFLIGADSFRRLIPQQYTGEGTFKFAPQLSMGELDWRYLPDNDCNLYGDFGQHIYQIIRAYQPFRPHAVCPIIYQRCPGDLGLTTCVSSVSGV